MRAVIVIAYLSLVFLGVLALRESDGPFGFATLFLILALPTGVFSAYLATLRRIHWLTMWSADSLVVRWLSGSWLRLLIALLLAFMASGLLSVRLSVGGWIDLSLIASCIALVLILNFFLSDWLLGQFNPIYRHGRSLFLIAILSAVLMSMLDPAARLALGGFHGYANFEDARIALREGSNWLGTSALSECAVNIGSYWAGLERFLIGRLFSDSGWSAWLGLLAAAVLKFPLYLAVGFSVCAFMLPKREYQRLLQPSLSEEAVQTPTAGGIALTSATVTIGVLFIYLPLVAVIEGALHDRCTDVKPQEILALAVEMIDGQAYPVGTMDRIAEQAAAQLQAQSELLAPVDVALTEGFSKMRESVEHYLDWYYSLPGEWGRVTMLLTGNIEAFLTARLSESLGAGDPFAAFEEEFALALAQHAEQLETFRANATAVLETSRIQLTEGEEVTVIARVDREELLTLPSHTGLTTIEQRLGLTAASTGISGVIAAAATRQILLRLATRGTLRTAAQALVRLATIRAGSAGGGGTLGVLIGGGVGSVVPGIGTAIGAGVGGVIGGLVVGVGAEFLILKLEELWARDRHRTELLAAIDEAEAALRAQFGLGEEAG